MRTLLNVIIFLLVLWCDVFDLFGLRHWLVYRHMLQLERFVARSILDWRSYRIRYADFRLRRSREQNGRIVDLYELIFVGKKNTFHSLKSLEKVKVVQNKGESHPK